MTPIVSLTCTVILIAFTLYGLIVGQDFLIPLVIAIAVWYFLISITSGIQKLSFNKFKIPYWLAFIGSLLLLVVLARLIFTIISLNVMNFIQEAPIYQKKFQSLFQNISDYLGLKDSPSFLRTIDNLDFVTIGSTFLGVLTLIASNLGLIFIYVLFLLLEQHTFPKKLHAILCTENQRSSAIQTIDTIGSKIQYYLWIKTLFSMFTGGVSYLVMTAIGLDFAGFWAFLIFILNYIPTIGSIIATIAPILFSILQFESLLPVAVLGLILVGIQFVIGNLIEPPLMGRSFDLSSLVILVALALFGKIWGILGMFLCVPILVISRIILDLFPTTQPISVFLSSGRHLAEEEGHH